MARRERGEATATVGASPRGGALAPVAPGAGAKEERSILQKAATFFAKEPR